ncbi:MAG TPA: Pycsar system effector family protein [Thermoanaerobaculia bacterium]|nr:Pycsar system effector family protein [Thermoanaerobaculia bacterium]
MALFDQIEGQVQFGDNKASLLIAGDAILLAISGGLIPAASSCGSEQFTTACLKNPSLVLIGACLSAGLLVFALACALWAARPASVHDNPPPIFFLLSYIARLDAEAFVKEYQEASSDGLTRQALLAIHGKARFAARKFKRLKWAINATLLSLLVLLLSLGAAIAKT